MSAPSPTLEGFRVAFRRPSVTFAEIAWRWVVGATAVAAFLFYWIEYLDTLPVSSSDALLLSTRQPALVGRAIEHILKGSLNRAVLAALGGTLALSVLWIIAASLGRLTTVGALLDYFRTRIIDPEITNFSGHADGKADAPQKPRPIRALIGLNSLRAAGLLAMLLALTGSAILASFVSSKVHPRFGLAIILFLLLGGIVSMLASWLNWWLSLACIFAVRDDEDTLGALSQAVSFFREHIGSVLAVGTWTGLAHLVAFSIATTAASFLFAFIQFVPVRLVFAGIIAIMLLYFAVADWLYVARLAGYICIAEMPDAALAASPLPPAIPPNETTVVTSIDRDEPILSDLPNLALET
jgi:hypothetical protein